MGKKLCVCSTNVGFSIIPGTYYVPDTNAPGISRQKSIRMYLMIRPWTHTSDDSYIYQLSLVVATATVSFITWYVSSTTAITINTYMLLDVNSYPIPGTRYVHITVVVVFDVCIYEKSSLVSFRL